MVQDRHPAARAVWVRIAGYMKLLLIPFLALGAYGADIQLKATPATVAWGYYWSAAKPVLRIKSGDTVEIQTLLTNSPERLAAAGVKAEEIEPELKAVRIEVRVFDGQHRVNHDFRNFLDGRRGVLQERDVRRDKCRAHHGCVGYGQIGHCSDGPQGFGLCPQQV